VGWGRSSSIPRHGTCQAVKRGWADHQQGDILGAVQR
jgi:hypothetical protein